MTFKELESQLLALTAVEKAQVIQMLSQTFHITWPGIEKTPGVMGGQACISRTRIPVWLLVNLRRLGCSETHILEDYPDLTKEELANAWAYADANPDEIEKAIRQQEEA